MAPSPCIEACSLVIRCYNEEQHIGKLLTGVLQQTVDVEIIVVDSGSIDATRSILSRFPVKLLSIEPERFSFGRALNLGCRVASHELIAIASAHVYPRHRDWLENLLRPFQDEHTALTYGKQRGDERTRFSERRIFETWFPEGLRDRQDQPFCNNANAAIRRSLWERFPYDEQLTGLEDLAWAKTAIEAGYRIAYVPDAEVVHVHEETARSIFNRFRREALALRTIYSNERFTLWDLARLLVRNIGSDSYHAAREGVLHKNLGNIAVFRTMQFLGTYRGHAQRSPVTRALRETFFYPGGRTTAGTTIAPIRDSQTIDYGQFAEDYSHNV